ncbi:unnamed protein product, partial [Owenia fusiformis]
RKPSTDKDPALAPVIVPGVENQKPDDPIRPKNGKRTRPSKNKGPEKTGNKDEYKRPGVSRPGVVPAIEVPDMSESEDPCTIDCRKFHQPGKRKVYCGSNNKSYRSMCDLLQEACRTKAEIEAFLPTNGKCKPPTP